MPAQILLVNSIKTQHANPEAEVSHHFKICRGAYICHFGPPQAHKWHDTCINADDAASANAVYSKLRALTQHGAILSPLCEGV
jgi:hypothetical protein